MLHVCKFVSATRSAGKQKNNQIVGTLKKREHVVKKPARKLFIPIQQSKYVWDVYVSQISHLLPPLLLYLYIYIFKKIL